MCDICYFISSVFEAARKEKLHAYMPVLMLLRELEKQKQIVLFAGDCPIDEVSFHLGEERHYTIKHYFKCVTHSRFSNDQFFLIGACIRGFPLFQVLDTLKNENLPDTLWGRTGSMFDIL